MTPRILVLMSLLIGIVSDAWAPNPPAVQHDRGWLLLNQFLNDGEELPSALARAAAQIPQNENQGIWERAAHAIAALPRDGKIPQASQILHSLQSFNFHAGRLWKSPEFRRVTAEYRSQARTPLEYLDAFEAVAHFVAIEIAVTSGERMNPIIVEEMQTWTAEWEERFGKERSLLSALSQTGQHPVGARAAVAGASPREQLAYWKEKLLDGMRRKSPTQRIENNIKAVLALDPKLAEEIGADKPKWWERWTLEGRCRKNMADLARSNP
jgi:hypothetical protein